MIPAALRRLVLFFILLKIAAVYRRKRVYACELLCVELCLSRNTPSVRVTFT